MYLNKVSVRIPEGCETQSGYVELKHGTTYSIALRNDRPEPCDAIVSVDGKPVGTWRVGGNSTIRLEHPADDEGRFTFYKVGSSEANASDAAGIASDLRGLVQVEFRHGLAARPVQEVHHYHHHYPRPRPYGWNYWTEWVNDWPTQSPQFGPVMRGASLGGTTVSANCCSTPEPPAEWMPQEAPAAGVTGLSGHSDQEYGHACAITHSTEPPTVISLRLVAVERERNDPRPLRPAVSGNPVPPPVAS